MAERAVAPALPMLAQQLKSALLISWRTPAFSLTSLVLPTILFVFFGLPRVNQTQSGVNAGAFLLASFGAYGATSVMLFSFGIGIAQQRATKSDLLIRATPVRPWIYLTAQALDAMFFALGTLLVLFLFGFAVGGIRLDALVWANLTWRLLAGSIPFIGLGFAIGYLTSANAAPAVLNLVYLPMAFASGLFIPADGLPSFIRALAPFLPTYRYGQLAWSAVGVHTDPLLTNVLWLVAYAVAFFAVALRAYRLEEERRFS